MNAVRRLYHFIFLSPLTYWTGIFLMVIGLVLSNLAPFFVKWLTESVQQNQLNHAFSLVLIFGVLLLLSNLISNLAILSAIKIW